MSLHTTDKAKAPHIAVMPIAVMPIVAMLATLLAPGVYAAAVDEQPATRTEKIDLSGDGIPDLIRRTEYTYTGKGLVAQRRVVIDSNADNTPDEGHLFVYQYATNGKKSAVLHGTDNQGDGVYDVWFGKNWWGSGTTARYREWKGSARNGDHPLYAKGWDKYDYIDTKDGSHNLSQINWIDHNGDGVTDYRTSRQFQYDASTGQLLEKNIGTDTNGSAPWEYYERRYYSYSANGNAFDYTSEIIRNGVSLPGAWGGEEKLYNSHGDILDESSWKGLGDGATSYVHNWYTYQYNQQGQMIAKTESEDWIGTAAAERWNSWTNSYYPDGGLKTVIHIGWQNPDLDPAIEINWSHRSVFNTDGQLRSRVSVRTNSISQSKTTTRETNTYDDRKRLIVSEQSTSKRLDGIAESIKVKSYIRSNNGSIKQTVTAIDDNADGIVDKTINRMFGY